MWFRHTYPKTQSLYMWLNWTKIEQSYKNRFLHIHKVHIVKFHLKKFPLKSDKNWWRYSNFNSVQFTYFNFFFPFMVRTTKIDVHYIMIKTCASQRKTSTLGYFREVGAIKNVNRVFLKIVKVSEPQKVQFLFSSATFLKSKMWFDAMARL